MQFYANTKLIEFLYCFLDNYTLNAFRYEKADIFIEQGGSSAVEAKQRFARREAKLRFTPSIA
jgi:hypothetical protein